MDKYPTRTREETPEREHWSLEDTIHLSSNLTMWWQSNPYLKWCNFWSPTSASKMCVSGSARNIQLSQPFLAKPTSQRTKTPYIKLGLNCLQIGPAF